MVVMVMGVSGRGKPTVGQRITEQLGCAFCDGDELHSEADRAKIHAGIPLNDDNRKPQLESIRTYMDEKASSGQSLVAACSALEQRYCDVLRGAIDSVEFVYLKGDFDLLQGRLAIREDHFFNPNLLHSQFDAPEESTDIVIVDTALPPEVIVGKVAVQLQACAAYRPAA